MKKFMSLILACALALTCVVMPLTVSAAKITDRNATVVFNLYTDAAGENPLVGNAYRGQNLYAVATLDVAEEEVITEVELAFTIDTTAFTVGVVEGLTGNYLSAANNFYYYAEGLNIADGGKLVTIPLTVKAETVSASGAIGAKVAAGDHTLYAASNNWYMDANVLYTEATATIGNYDIEMSFDADGAEGSPATVLDATTDTKIFRNAEANGIVTVTVDPEVANSITITITNKEEQDAEAEVVQSPFVLDAFGNYTVTVTVTGQAPVSRTIKYAQTTTSRLEADADENLVKLGETFTIPVMLYSTEGAAMLSFDVLYDADRLTLANPSANATGEKAAITWADKEGGKTIVYGDDTGNEIILGAGSNESGVEVVTLTFTANEGTVVGDQTVIINNQVIVYGDDLYQTTNGVIATEAIDNLVTLYSDTAYGSASKTYDEESWQKDEYEETFTPALSGAAGVKYYVGGEVTEENVESIYENNATALVNGNTIPVASKDTIYVITKVGTNKYEITDVLVNGTDIFFDPDAPIITATANEEWQKRTAELTFAVSVTDELSDVETTSYLLVADGAAAVGEYVEFTDAVPLGEVATGNYDLYIKAVDNAGNEAVSPAPYTIKVDADAPVIDAEVGQLVGSSKTVEFTVTDAGSGVASMTQVVVKRASTESDVMPEDGEGVVDLSAAITYDPATGEGSFVAESAGYYFIQVTDNVGNVSLLWSELIELDITSVAPVAQAVVIVGSEEYAPFMSDTELATFEGAKTNGTFTHVTIEEPVASDANHTVVYSYTVGEAPDVHTITFIEGKFTFDVTGVINLTAKEYLTAAGAEATDSAVNTYTFEIVADKTGIASVNDDNKFTMVDYAIMKRVAASDDPFANLAAEFTGGYFAGDVDGSLAVDKASASTDASLILAQIRRAVGSASYDFDIYND